VYILPTLSLAEIAAIFLTIAVLSFGVSWAVRTVRGSLLLRRIWRFVGRVVEYLRGG
jgi:hypothetical protein